MAKTATKKAAVPAQVVRVAGTGDVFDVAATKPNAVVLLDSNTVSVSYTPAFHKFKPAVQQALTKAENEAPILTLQRPLLPNGMVDTNSNDMIIAALSDRTFIYDTKKLGRLREFPGGYFIHTHYHSGVGCDFSYDRLEESLRNYCEMAYILGAKDRPVVINLPGLQCRRLFDQKGAVKEEHIGKVSDIIADTMFAGSTVYLVL